MEVKNFFVGAIGKAQQMITGTDEGSGSNDAHNKAPLQSGSRQVEQKPPDQNGVQNDIISQNDAQRPNDDSQGIYAERITQVKNGESRDIIFEGANHMVISLMNGHDYVAGFAHSLKSKNKGSTTFRAGKNTIFRFGPGSIKSHVTENSIEKTKERKEITHKITERNASSNTGINASVNVDAAITRVGLDGGYHKTLESLGNSIFDIADYTNYHISHIFEEDTSASDPLEFRKPFINKEPNIATETYINSLSRAATLKKLSGFYRHYGDGYVVSAQIGKKERVTVRSTAQSTSRSSALDAKVGVSAQIPSGGGGKLEVSHQTSGRENDSGYQNTTEKTGVFDRLKIKTRSYDRDQFAMALFGESDPDKVQNIYDLYYGVINFARNCAVNLINNFGVLDKAIFTTEALYLALETKGKKEMLSSRHRSECISCFTRYAEIARKIENLCNDELSPLIADLFNDPFKLADTKFREKIVTLSTKIDLLKDELAGLGNVILLGLSDPHYLSVKSTVDAPSFKGKAVEKKHNINKKYSFSKFERYAVVAKFVDEIPKFSTLTFGAELSFKGIGASNTVSESVDLKGNELEVVGDAQSGTYLVGVFHPSRLAGKIDIEKSKSELKGISLDQISVSIDCLTLTRESELNSEWKKLFSTIHSDELKRMLLDKGFIEDVGSSSFISKNNIKVISGVVKELSREVNLLEVHFNNKNIADKGNTALEIKKKNEMLVDLRVIQTHANNSQIFKSGHHDFRPLNMDLFFEECRELSFRDVLALRKNNQKGLGSTEKILEYFTALTSMDFFVEPTQIQASPINLEKGTAPSSNGPMRFFQSVIARVRPSSSTQTDRPNNVESEVGPRT